MTELIYRALTLDSVYNFIKDLVQRLSIKGEIEIRVMRLPSYKSRIIGITNKGRIVDIQLHGRSWKDKNLIDIFPNCLFPNKFSRPCWGIGLRGFILNASIQALIHEFLHKSGIYDETQVRETTKEYYKIFRHKYLKQFDKEITPLLREWKRFEKSLGLR